MKVLRSLVSEFKISWNEWASLLPLVQSALNNYKSASLAGQDAITVFTCTILLQLFSKALMRFPSSNRKMEPDEILALVTDLKKSLEELHKKVETSSGAERARSHRKSGST